MRQDGIYTRISRAEYDATPATNQSSLKHMGKSPMNYLWHLNNPDRESTEAQKLGQLVSCLWLEGPSEAANRFIVKPEDINRRGAKNQAIYDEWMEENKTKTVITQAIAEEANAIVSALNGNSELVKIIKRPSVVRETMILWTDPVTGRRCKGLLDILDLMETGRIIFDLKSDKDISEWAFSAAIYRYGYHFQSAWYMDGLAALGIDVTRYGLIAVSKSAPYESTLYWLDDQAIAAGRAEYRRLLGKVIECEETGTWPGPEMGQTIGLPRYAYNQQPQGEDE